MGRAPGKRRSIKDEIPVFQERAGQRKMERAQQRPKQRGEGDQVDFLRRPRDRGQEMRPRWGLIADNAGAAPEPV